MEGDLILQHVLDHLVILSLKQLEDVIPCYVEVGIVGDGDLKLHILSQLSDQPGIVNKFSSLFKLWIHDHRHEIVFINHPFEGHFHEEYLSISLVSWTALLFLTFALFLIPGIEIVLLFSMLFLPLFLSF